MLGNILSTVGGILGKRLGGGILSAIGRYAGRKLGDYLNKKWFMSKQSRTTYSNLRESFNLSMAEYGKPIPLIFGRVKIPGQIIWADETIQRRNESETSKYIKSSNTKITDKKVEFEYFLSFAMCICVGEIEDIERVWFCDEIVDLSKYKFRLYKGSNEQEPDPLILQKNGEMTPAYRGMAYIVFEELPLKEFGDVIPQFSFEVMRRANIKRHVAVEDMVDSMVMIPGSGEFVYDTKVQTKFSHRNHAGQEVNSLKINSHNHYKIADSLHSLNQLNSTCPNVKWIAPVVCWFGNNMDIKDCLIQPAIEFRDPNVSYSEEWKVSRYNRENAYEITKDEHGNPQYGGTINDASIIRYLQELRKREYNIMFYPMFQMDVDGKPWRGRVTGSAEHVERFFNRAGGYNEFILHYAHLVKDHVDAFIIGTELIGLTKIRSGNQFPVVDQFVSLAEQVKKIVGDKVKVSYAADWSEYHHTEGGWYNLDPLWASDSIDFIGIDVYFPVTDAVSSQIPKEDIDKGFYTGEGCDFYRDGSYENTKPLSPKYAWKNIAYWWSNHHFNPDNRRTPWKPCSKKIWFTEYGFPSIDKAPNQPNVFYDERCVDGGAPRHSNSRTDFDIQRKAIKSFVEYWKTQEYVEQMFLWCWDARPYPAWPVANIWSDGCLWEKGHWVNYKFGSGNLSSILLEISYRCGLDIEKIDVSSVDEKVEGLILSNSITGLNAINSLRAAYFFDINAHEKDIIAFKKRGADHKIKNVDDFALKLHENSYVEVAKTDEIMKINDIGIFYINYNKDYSANHMRFNRESSSAMQTMSLHLPIVLHAYEVENIGNAILTNAYNESEMINFKICDPKISINPSDFIQIKDIYKQYTVRVVDTSIDNDETLVTGIIDQQTNYIFAKSYDFILNSSELYFADDLIILDLPMRLSNSSDSYLAIYLYSKNGASLYAQFREDLVSDQWNYVSELKASRAIGKIEEFNRSGDANIYMIDTASSIIVSAERLDAYNSNSWQYALAGQEIVKFKKIERVNNGIYRISHLIRGLHGTEEHIILKRNNEEEGEIGEYFIILEQNCNIVDLAQEMQNREIYFKASGIKKKILFQNNAQNRMQPLLLSSQIDNNILHIKWMERDENIDNWTENSLDRTGGYEIIISSNENEYRYNSEDSEIDIDISQLDLSDNFKISIINID